MTKAKAAVQGDDFLGGTSLSVKDRMLCLQWAVQGPAILIFSYFGALFLYGFFLAR